jgi:dTDP-glucose pyrophosphorylase
MHNWKQSLIPASTTLRETIKNIDATAIQIALVVDQDQRLLGTVTDGDVRRGILRGLDLDTPVSLVMNKRPTTCRVNEARENILAVMRQKYLHQIPILDDHGRVTGIEILDGLLLPSAKSNPVVIMAGGLGNRLRPLTDDCPKPMLKIGAKPILETILESLQEFGFRNFFFSVNYKAEMIKEYFGDGSRWGISIKYLEEDKQLGTAGALGLLPEKPVSPMIVMNGDLLTKVNFEQLLNFHAEYKAPATMCVREYDIQIPFGVVTIEDQRIRSIDEKPLHKFFVNAGIYVIEPSVLALIPRGTHIDMTTIFERLVEQGKKTAVFPVREYWLDIGQLDDLERARLEYGRLFG